MSLKFLARIEPDVSDEFLGGVVTGMVTAGAVKDGELGFLIREGLRSTYSVSDADSPDADSPDTMTAMDVPLRSYTQNELLQLIYGSYTTYRRRSLFALTQITGLRSSAVLELIEGNSNLRTYTGRDSGEVYVSICEAARRGAVVAEDATDVPVLMTEEVGNGLPETSEGRRVTLLAIYNSYTVHRRRSLGALARITGLRPSALMVLINGNDDFRISTGRDSGEVYVSVRGISD